MGRRYSGYGTDLNTASTTQVELRSTTAIRPAIYHMIVGPSSAAPQDYNVELVLRRTTTAGTSTPFTPVQIDPGDPAATATFGVNHSAEPTYTANADLLHFGVNLRATYTFMAYPNSELRLPAAANGAGLLAVAVTTAFNSHYQIYWEE